MITNREEVLGERLAGVRQDELREGKSGDYPPKPAGCPSGG